MRVYRFLALLGLALPLAAQTPCAPTPMYSPCDIVFELNAQEAGRHPNPYLTVQLQAEFRSPRKRTFLMPAFWDGGTRMVIRFSPTEAGDWDFRVTSNLTRFDGTLGKFTATESSSPGFVKAANVHHWAYSESNKAHLWMGDTNYRFAEMDRALFEQFVKKRAGQKFNHVRGVVVGMSGDGTNAFPAPDQPDTAWFREVDSRVRFLNQNGLTLDLVIAQHENHLTKLFPTWQQRERYVRYLVARYAAMDITWQGVQEFDDYSGGRALMKEVGLLLKKLDPYQHPRSTHTRATSAPLAADGWMDYLTYQSSDDDLGAIEHQLYQLPQVNAEFAYEDSGAGRVYPHHVDSDTFRKRLWNATMNGQYPTFGNTGTYGGQAKLPQDAKYLDSPGAKAMTAWFDFFMRTRHWELEPFFDVDGGRALALDDIEYIVYVEKPSAPIEVLVAKHNYDVYWFDPATGELAKQKNFNGDKYVGEPPDKKHDWVLHLSRDGRKEGMLRSYKFESRPVPIQEVETNLQKVPYEIAQPAADEISLSRPFQYAVKLKRETRATRSMMYLWTGEVPTEGQGFRVMAAGASGSLPIPAYIANTIARDFPAVFALHVAGMNANGKVYFTSKVYRLVK